MREQHSEVAGCSNCTYDLRVKIIPLLNTLQRHSDHAAGSTAADAGIAVKRSSINQLWCGDGDDEACQKRSKTETELHVGRKGSKRASGNCREGEVKERMKERRWGDGALR